MDFIEGLPKVDGKSVILTIINRFSRYAHFIALGHPYTATSVARPRVLRQHRPPSWVPVVDRQ